jgi:hypothetical protein
MTTTNKIEKLVASLVLGFTAITGGVNILELEATELVQHTQALVEQVKKETSLGGLSPEDLAGIQKHRDDMIKVETLFTTKSFRQALTNEQIKVIDDFRKDLPPLLTLDPEKLK